MVGGVGSGEQRSGGRGSRETLVVVSWAFRERREVRIVSCGGC